MARFLPASALKSIAPQPRITLFLLSRFGWLMCSHSLGVSEMKIFGVVLAAITLLAGGETFAYAADNPATGTFDCPTNSVANVAGLAVTPCYRYSFSAPLQGSFDKYYGAAGMHIRSGGSVKARNTFGKALRGIFEISGKFEATIAVEVRRNDILVSQRPIFSVTVDDSDGTNIEMESWRGSNLDASPWYLLGTDRNEFTVRLVAMAAQSSNSDAVGTVKKVVDIASTFGGHGWLVTAVASEAFMAEAARVEGAINSANKSNLKNRVNTVLKFGPAGSVTSVFYKIAIPSVDGATASAEVEVYLKTTESLVVADMKTDPSGVPTYSESSLPSGRWAEAIKLRGETKSLANFLDDPGVVRSLDDLKVEPYAQSSVTVPRLTQINNACLALKRALSSGEYRLNKYDADLVLYNELDTRQIFSTYNASLLQCLADRRTTWTKLKLARQAIYPSTADQRVKRLDVLAGRWGNADDSQRPGLIAENFLAPIQLTADPAFLPSRPATIEAGADGFATWPLSPGFLAERRKKCFGMFKKPPEDTNWATAFARFENDPRLYFVKATFDDQEPIGSLGPRIRAISIAPATDEDIKLYRNDTGSCLTPAD